jgi:predicted nucleotidyltransferase
MAPRPPSTILAELRGLRDTNQLASTCAELGIELLVAFGSTLVEEAAPRDLDLAVLFSSDRDPIRATGEIIGWLRTDDVDVLDLRRAEVVARYEALAKGELLYERTYGTFDELQVTAVLRYADTRWLRDLQLEAMRR